MSVASITFVDAPRGLLDRGWDPSAIIRALDRHSVASRRLYVESCLQLEEALRSPPEDTLYWPLDYTFTGSPVGPMIVDVLERHGVPFIGCGSNAMRLTSKLVFKRALRRAGLPTPPWHELAPPFKHLEIDRYPVFVKTEYSCDSQGVRRATDLSGVKACASELTSAFRQKVFLEMELGAGEWSIACITVGDELLTAALRFTPTRAPFVDAAAKSDNELIRFDEPTSGEMKRLRQYAITMTRDLELSGYFRLDVLAASDGTLNAIDLNLLPCLESDPGRLSYLPMAFLGSAGADYDHLLGALIASAHASPDAIDPKTPLGRLVLDSAFLANMARVTGQ